MTQRRVARRDSAASLVGLLTGMLVAIVASTASAQEDAISAAQRPVVHAPPIIVPTQPSTDTLPKWSEFPAPPTDVPTVPEIAAQVNTQTAAAAKLKADVAALVWDNDQPEAYATAARSRLNPAFMKKIDATLSNQEIESLARELRRRATPPPRVD